MELELKGRVAIVTGSSKGIGKAIALSLAAEGAHVAICAREKDPLLLLQKEIEGRGGSVVAIPADVTKAESIQKIISQTIDRFGKLDILINNVGGVKKFGGFFELTDNEWKEAFELNVMTVVSFIRQSMPWLKKSISPRVINISSISGVEPGFSNPHYNITKAAIINMSKHLANVLVKDKILVNVVCPGPVHSSSWSNNVQNIAENRNIPYEKAWEEFEEQESAKIPIGRVGEGSDISDLVVFLSSDKASWITGSCFHINGGKLKSAC